MNELVWIETTGGVMTGAYYPKSNLEVVVANLQKQGYKVVEIRESR